MDPVPEGIEQKLPASRAFMFARRCCRSHGTGPRLCQGGRSARCPRRARPAGASVRARFAIHSATGTVNPRLRENASAAGSARASHLRRMYLPTPFLIFSASGKTEGELGDHGIEERRAPLESVRHQAAIDLQQKIVGQPIGAIERLRLLEPACRPRLRCAARRRPCRRRQPLGVAQDAEPVEQAAAAHLAAAEPARPAARCDSARSRRTARRRPRRRARPSRAAPPPWQGGRSAEWRSPRPDRPSPRRSPGSVVQKSFSVTSISMCSAPTARATAFACARSSRASVPGNPAVKAWTGRSFSRAMQREQRR